MKQDMAKSAGGNSGSRERSQSSLSSPIGFDPGRDGFNNARLLWVACRLSQFVSKKTSELSYGAWNPDFCSADAASNALRFFSDLTKEIDWFANQAAEALCSASARSAKSERTGA